MYNDRQVFIKLYEYAAFLALEILILYKKYFDVSAFVIVLY